MATDVSQIKPSGAPDAKHRQETGSCWSLLVHCHRASIGRDLLTLLTEGASSCQSPLREAQPNKDRPRGVSAQ